MFCRAIIVINFLGAALHKHERHNTIVKECSFYGLLVT